MLRARTMNEVSHQRPATLNQKMSRKKDCISVMALSAVYEKSWEL